MADELARQRGETCEPSVPLGVARLWHRRRLARFVLTLAPVMLMFFSPLLPAANAAETVVSLTFDDTLASQYQTRSMLSSRGLQGTFYVNSGRVGTGGYMTQVQLSALQSDGNEIAGHTVNHADLPTVDSDEQKRQVCDDRVNLLNWGFAVTSFAYPYGHATAETEQIVQSCGYNSGRGVGGLATGSCPSCPYAETIPPTDPYLTRTTAEIVSSTSLAEIEDYVAQAEQHGGGWVMLIIHNVCDSCGTLAISPSTLGAFLDWLAPRRARGTLVKTVHQVIGGTVQPGVSGPPPPPPIAAGNMLKNPSVEDDSDSDGIPDCWRPNSSGTNTSVWSRTTDAHTGSFAQRVDVVTYSSGAVRLLSRQDLGFCAPSAVAGHAYKVSAWYKATAQPIFVAFYRDSVGAWRSLGQSEPLGKRSTWKKASWTTPAIPSGGTAIGVGLALRAVGSLTMDDFTLVDAQPQ